MIQEYSIAFLLIKILSGICFFLFIILLIILMTEKPVKKKDSNKIQTYRDRLK